MITRLMGIKENSGTRQQLYLSAFCFPKVDFVAISSMVRGMPQMIRQTYL